MARKLFYSFHYDGDSQRASQVRNMNQFEAQAVLGSNEWEEVKEEGDRAVYDWIDDQLSGKSCLVVLIGAATAGRKFVKYEIESAWNKNKGVLGVDVDGLKDLNGQTSSRGRNPFDDVVINGTSLSYYVERKSPPFPASTDNYAHIRDNLAQWVEDAIAIRGNS